jgi:hypothetical protein
LRNLDLAIAIWRSGRRISLILETKLIADGYDVARLEARHAQ